MTLKKTLAVVTAASLPLTLAACGGDDSSSASGSGAGDNYVIVNGSEPQNPLIPANTNETGGGRIVDSLYSGLVYWPFRF